MIKRFWGYGLYVDNAVKYFGITSEKPKRRLSKHLTVAKSAKEDSLKDKWIRQMLAEGKEIEIVLLGGSDYSRDEAYKFERILIATARALDIPIVNSADGGSGVSGIKRSEETKRKDSALKPKKAVIQLSIEGIEIARYQSSREASRQTGIDQGSISSVCRGRSNTAGNYRWSYVPFTCAS